MLLDDLGFQEGAECPLCLEEMDISDLNFKPCVCGYQVSYRLFCIKFQTFIRIFHRFVVFAGTILRKI